VPESLIPPASRGGAFARPGRSGFRGGLAGCCRCTRPPQPADARPAAVGRTRRDRSAQTEDWRTPAPQDQQRDGTGVAGPAHGRERLIAETGAACTASRRRRRAPCSGCCEGLHGRAGHGRQAHNVFRMRLLGAEVVPVTTGSRTLKDATSAAERHWVADADEGYYCVGSVIGPHPYPTMVREFQRVIGDEAGGSARPSCPPLSPITSSPASAGQQRGGHLRGFVDTTAKLVGVEAEGVPVPRTARSAYCRLSVAVPPRRSRADQEAHSIAAALTTPASAPSTRTCGIGARRYVTVCDRGSDRGGRAARPDGGHTARDRVGARLGLVMHAAGHRPCQWLDRPRHALRSRR